MKTRKSMSGEDEKAEDHHERCNQEDTDNNEIVSPPIVRKLRSRVITPDRALFKIKTPKSQRKSIKDNASSSFPNDNEVETPSTDSRKSVSLTKTPKSIKRFSAANLFKIIEEKEEMSIELNNQETGSKYEVLNRIISKDHSPVKETVMSSNEGTRDISILRGNGEEFSNQESVTKPFKFQDESTGRDEMQEDGAKKNYFDDDQPIESENDSETDNMPEAVPFSISKNMVSMELSAIAEAISREKEKKKERTRKKIEMIRSQKAEKEKKQSQKMKFIGVSVPERLTEDVTSTLPDSTDIAPPKKSVSMNKKKKNDEKGMQEHRVEKKKNKIMKFDDYIPIAGVEGATQFGVVPLELASRLPKPSSQSAAEFKRSTLFGSRIKREPSKNLLIYRQKLSASGNLQNGFRSSGSLKI
ncbi:transcriptional regulator ATRX homolog isoform X2 [Hetaerina americana]|uniref:transcriptional regulator ATRX homolog isoform X2 n=1 Tax=Hetaerina americana TaxID=62018 RepID=UPI003A7F1780